MYVKGVKSSSIYTIRAAMIYMSEVLKEVQNFNIFANNFLDIELIFNLIEALASNAMYVVACQRYQEFKK